MSDVNNTYEIEVLTAAYYYYINLRTMKFRNVMSHKIISLLSN